MPLNSVARMTRWSLIVCGLMLSASSALSQVPALPPAKDVHSVLNVAGQACNGKLSSAMSPHEDWAKVKKSRRLEVPSIGVDVDLPQLPDIDGTGVQLVLNERSRGVVEHYVLLNGEFLSAPNAAIVFTELPSELGTRSAAFDVVMGLERRNAAKVGVMPVFHTLTGPFGDALENITHGRISSRCFPTSDWQMADGSKKDSIVTITRFVVIDRKLVEFALVLKVGPQHSESEKAAYARKIMDGFWQSLKVREHKGAPQSTAVSATSATVSTPEN